MTKAKYAPRVERATTKLWVPHNAGEIAFASPAFRGDYQSLGNQILNATQKVPHGDYTASLLHTTYCSDAKTESEFENVRNIMKNNGIYIFNQNLWTENGVYVVQDVNADGRSKQLDINKLEKKLKGGVKLSWGGIRFSKDNSVRFAPKESYKLGEHSPKLLAKDGFIITSFGEDGAEKIGEVSAKFKNKPYTFGINIEKGQEPKQRVSGAGEVDGGFRFYGYVWYVDAKFPAFGVLK